MKKLVPKKPLQQYYSSLFKTKSPYKNVGVYSFVISSDEINDYIGDINSLYARENLGLKVFIDDIEPLSSFTWGSKEKGNEVLLTDVVKIQNLAALYNLAPKIYDIVLTTFRDEDKYAFVTDYLKGNMGIEDDRHELVDKLRSVMELYGIQMVTVDPNLKNIIDKKYTDFQVFRFVDKNKFKERILERANNATDWGSKTGISYQSVGELGVEGQRDTKHRMEVFQMDNYDFKNKTVLDIGCSTGSFCRYAVRRGAKRVVGVDIGEVPKVAAEISIYFGDYNADFYNFRFNRDDYNDYLKLQKLTGLKEFDIVFFLSVNQQVGYPTKYMKELCKEAIFVEGHSGDHEETYRPLLEKDFKNVIFKGRMKNNARPALVGIK